MHFIHNRFNLQHNQAVEVTCSHQCNLLLLDDSNFYNYQRGLKFNYKSGGFFKQFPTLLVPPSQGVWNFVLDTAGIPANINHGIRIVNI